MPPAKVGRANAPRRRAIRKIVRGPIPIKGDQPQAGKPMRAQQACPPHIGRQDRKLDDNTPSEHSRCNGQERNCLAPFRLRPRQGAEKSKCGDGECDRHPELEDQTWRFHRCREIGPRPEGRKDDSGGQNGCCIGGGPPSREREIDRLRVSEANSLIRSSVSIS